MRRLNNSEQPSPARRVSQRKRTNRHLSGYAVGMSGKGRCGNVYNACRNLMNTFGENEEQGNGVEEHENVVGEWREMTAENGACNVVGRAAQPNACREERNHIEERNDIDEEDSSATMFCEDEHERHLREDVRRFLDASDKCGINFHACEDEEKWRKRRKSQEHSSKAAPRFTPG